MKISELIPDKQERTKLKQICDLFKAQYVKINGVKIILEAK